MNTLARQTLKKLGIKTKPSAPDSATFKNGIGAYIQPCYRIDILYDHPRAGRGGSSRGVLDLIAMSEDGRGILAFAKENPSVHITFTPATRRSHPKLTAYYLSSTLNTQSRTITSEIKNLKPQEILERMKELKDRCGLPDTRFSKTGGGAVMPGGKESVIGVWDPFHDDSGKRFMV